MCKDPTCTLVRDNAELKEHNKKLSDEIAWLKNRIDWFERQIYGQKTERFVPDSSLQTQLPLEGIAAEEKKRTIETITCSRTKPNANKTPHGRIELPAHLPRERVVIPADFDTTGMEKIGEKITEELHYEPPVFTVKQLVREVFATINNGGRTLVCVDMPPRCIDKGKAGPSVVAQAIVTKCVDHNPLYRFDNQIQRYCGFTLPYSTLNEWYAKGIFWLECIARRLHQLIFQSGYVQMDESTIRVMIQPTNGKSHLGYMMVSHAPELKIVSFRYFDTRNQRHVRELIGENYEGIIQTDGLDIYDFLSRSDGVIHAGCWAHGRRGFVEALKNDGERAQWMLDKCKILFAVEDEAKELKYTPQQRLELRKLKSAPVVAEIKPWLDSTIREATPKSGIGKAIGYMLNRWNELIRFLSDGRIELSDNGIENRIRVLALGRKNWMFAGSEEGARRLAIAYTVLGTALLNGFNPFVHLCKLFEELPQRKAGDIDDLLPINPNLLQK